MKVECRLKDLLGEYGLDRHGVIQEIAGAVGVNRHTIAKLYNDRASSVTFDLLSRLCNWLAKNDVPTDELPGALFGSGRAPLWNAIARQGGEVAIYLGEYQPTPQAEVVWRWISRRDSAVASMIVRQLSVGTEGGSPPPRINFQYVPFRFSPADRLVNRELLDLDIARTKDCFDRMQQDARPGTSVIIGSQRVNYLLEFFVAELFGCRPFTVPAGEPSVPFFSVYRPSDPNTPSCFGGQQNPFRRRDNDVPGLHYLNERGNWVTCPWVLHEQDAAIVISMREHRRKAVDLAVFGFSGRATEAAGEQLLMREDLFWPPPVRLKTRDIGVYICRMAYAPHHADSDSEGRVQISSCDVIPLADRILERLVSR